MNQKQFAQLCAITQQMVSKYVADGRVVTRASGEIDASASLDALAGHLDEEKRAAAREKLAFLSAGAESSRPASPAPAATPQKSSPKAEHDAIKRDLAALELAQKSGQLIPVAEVEERIFDAVAKMRQAHESTLRSDAERLAHDLGQAQDKVPLILRHMKRAFVNAQTAFVAALEAEAALDVAPEEIAAE